MDFTIKTYKQLLKSLQNAGFSFMTFGEYIENKEKGKRKRESGIRNVYPVKSRSEYFTGAKFVILRHDVDALPENSLRFARIQAEMDIKGTYYFRVVPQSWDENIINEIHSLGHEVGYHYESLTTTKGDLEKGIKDFETNLKKLRELAPVNTICMHGSPRSPFDSKDLWNYYYYRDYGIMGEPYFDIDFDKIFYITDTGRMWDGFKVSVRDIVNTSKYWPVYHSTKDIIRALEKGQFPQQAMFTFHPQRWHDKPIPWLKEFIWQNVKNQGKRMLIAARRKR